MTNETIIYIDKLAEKVKEYGKDIREIVVNLGGTIEEMSCFDFCIDPTVCKTDNGFILRVSKGRVEEEAPIALGNLLLHLGYRTSNEVWNKVEKGKFYRFIAEPQYIQANYFSKVFEVSNKKYIEVFNRNIENKRVNVKKISEELGISVSDIVVRGRILGLIE